MNRSSAYRLQLRPGERGYALAVSPGLYASAITPRHGRMAFPAPACQRGPFPGLKKQKGGPEDRPCLTPPGRDGIIRRVCHSQTSTFLTLSWGLLFSICFALPFGPVSVGCGTPLAFLCPRPCGQAAMQAAPAIAVQVFALAGRPGPCPGTSWLARQGARWRQRCLVFFPFRKPFDVGPQLSDALFSFWGSYRHTVHLSFLQATVLTAR